MTEPTPKKFTFKQAEPGQQPSAENQNKVHEAINFAAGRPNVHPKKPTRALKLMRMSEVLGQMGEGTQSDSSMAHRRKGVVQYYDPGLNDFTPTSDDETKNNITDAIGLPVDADEKIWCVYSEQSGHWHPVNPRSIRTARTVLDESGNYPESGANVYPIKYLRMTYEKTPGLQTPTETFLDDNDERPDDVVFNLFEGDDCNAVPWIPPDTNIWVFNVLGYWYTWFDSCSEESSSSGAPGEIVRFRLTGSLLMQNGYANAVIRNWNPLIADYEDGAPIEVYDWWQFSAAGRGMWCGMGAFAPGDESFEGWAVYKEGNKYDIIWMEQFGYGIVFALSENMGYTSSGRAAASVIKTWHQGVGHEETGDPNITVYDPYGLFSDALSGAYGIAWRDEYEDQTGLNVYYRIVACQRAVMRINAQLSANCCGGAATIKNLQMELVGEFVLPVTIDDITVSNSAAHYGLEDDYVALERIGNSIPFAFEIRDVLRHEVDITTDLWADGEGLKRKYVTAGVELCADPIEQTIFQFTDCENSSSGGV